MYIAYINIYNTRYFIGLYKAKKEALEAVKKIDGAIIEKY